MEDSTLAISDFEEAMSILFRPAEAELPEFADSDFDTVSRLLTEVGKPQWSYRPRTYAVLRILDRVDLFNAFILEGLKDIAFPYTDSRLPNSMSPTAKAKFLQAQKLVLTKASDLEKIDGRHRHLDEDADAHFHNLKILGRGAFGEVNHVRSKLSLEEYAVCNVDTFSKDKEAIKIFENELTNLKRLSHHHVVKFIGSYTDPKYVGLLMSPVAECELKFFLERSPFPSDDLHLLRGFFGCLCSAVLYLHNSKCRHKDLKPGNILVYDNDVLIADFGTARDWSEQSRSTTTGRSGAYTPGYAAPEVVHEDPRNSSADIWSLGCIYLDMTTIPKGESMASKNRFFAENGTGGANPRSNSKALELWLARLKSEMDNKPIEWITQMIKKAPNERITAAGLMEQIYTFEGGLVYYNSCCNGEEESEDGTSYQGSIIEDHTSAVSHSQHPTRAWIDEGAAHMKKSASSSDLDEESIERQALPLSLPDIMNQIEPEAVVQHVDSASEDKTTDALTTQLLSDNGFDFHADGFKINHALFWAAKNGHEAVMQLLLEKGADIEVGGKSGKTALYRATSCGHESIVRLLLEKGANIEAKGNNNGWVALHSAAYHGHKVIVELLLEEGANIETKSNNGRTALQNAATQGHEAIVRLLLEKRADIEAKSNNKGWVALNYAAYYGHEVIVRLLLEEGANIEAKSNNGGMALHTAAKQGHEAIVRLLLEKKANIETKDNNRRTALYWATKGKHKAVIQLLKKK